MSMQLRDPQVPKTNNDIILSVKGVSKKFCRNLKRSYMYGLKDIGGELLGLRQESNRLRHGEFWALQDISLELSRGHSIGLAGLNGSGKTTLLRIISGLMKPDKGYVNVRGRIAALIALGAGFNPLLSGRENVFINMSILGLSKREILDVFDEVVEFAEVWDAIDAPVRTYSSGMKARLGFACAIYTRPSLLLIDEALAVGDVKFRVKCYQRLNEIRELGTSFFMVSHNPNIILRTCETGIYLRKGQVVCSGPVDLVMKEYDNDIKQSTSKTISASLMLSPKEDDNEIYITSVFLRNQDNELVDFAFSGEPLKICLKCRSSLEGTQIAMGILIREFQAKGDCLLNLHTDKENDQFFTSNGEFEFQLCLPYCGLGPGTYTAKMSIFRYPFHVYDMVESFNFQVKSKKQMSQCAFFQPHTWRTVPIL